MPRPAIAAILLAVSLTASCAGSGQPDTTARPSSPTSSTPSSTPSSIGPSTGAPTATGPLLRMREAEVRAPSGWRREPALVDTMTTAGQPGRDSTISLGSIDSLGFTSSLAQLAASKIRVSGYLLRPRRLPEVELDGKPVFHIGGPISRHLYLDGYGRVQRGRIVTIDVELDRSVPAAQRRQVVDSVLATFRWR